MRNERHALMNFSTAFLGVLRIAMAVNLESDSGVFRLDERLPNNGRVRLPFTFCLLLTSPDVGMRFDITQ